LCPKGQGSQQKRQRRLANPLHSKGQRPKQKLQETAVPLRYAPTPATPVRRAHRTLCRAAPAAT
jgi:hypothetical protein